jgi:alpha-L-fucosidase
MRTKFWFIFTVLFFSSFFVMAQTEESDNKTGPTNRNKTEREEWLRDLGFGMFIHWSHDSQLGVVIGHTMVGASDDYTNRFIYELPQTFDPYNYDPYRMAIQAKLAGAKYMVLTAKHHSGFCLWDTKTTDFNITNTPYKRDIVKEFVEGTRKAGLAVGIYYSPEDFKFLYDNNISVQRGGLKFTNEIAAAYDDLIRKQTRELFTKYGKIDILFIDGNPKEACRDEAWNRQPNVVITRGAVNTPEQHLPGIASDRLWESCITMGTQWQYKPTNDNLKSATRLIEILVETRAKGGNLLLNVGPKPDGTIADPEERRLTEMAAWNFINKEAIENVRPWIVVNEGNIWYTASKDRKTVYAVITGIPDWQFGKRKEFILSSIKATPQTKISVLGQNSRVVEYQLDNNPESRFTQKEDGLHISVVRAQRIYNNYKWPNPITVKLENVEPALVPPHVVTGKAIVAEGSVKLNGNIQNMGDAQTLKVYFEWRPYAGFTETLNFTDWYKTDEKSEQSATGVFTQTLQLEKGKTYEFRAVVQHPLIRLYGDIVRFTAK